MIPPHFLQANVTRSTTCLCRSATVWPLAASSSAAEPNTICSPHAWSHCQIGITDAQKRWREMDQSRAPSSHLPNRPSLMCSGVQPIFWASLMALVLILVTETNHDEVA